MNQNAPGFLAVWAAFSIFASVFAQADAGGAIPIDAFRTVSPGFYRGARPGTAGLEALAHELAIKTDIDLENNDDAIQAEVRDTQALGVHLVSIPMSGFFAPKNSAVNEALAVLRDAANYPVYVHCEYGHDRTGLIVGLFRVEAQGVSPAEAYAEMKADGFHPLLLGLNHYFEERTGFDD